MLKTMNILDAGLLMLESPETPMHIGGVQVLRMPRNAGRDFVHQLRARAMQHPVRSAPFNYRLARKAGPLGMPAWEVLDRVDLEDHVFHHALPWPGGERELFALVSRLNSGPLDRSRPLWEQHFIEGLDGHRFATFTRVHHSLMDGQWGVRLAKETSSPDPRARDLPPYWAIDLDMAPPASAAQAAKAAAKAAPRESWWARKSVAVDKGPSTAAQVRKAFGRLIDSFVHRADDGLVPIYTAPGSILNGRLTPRREFAVASLPLTRIKDLAHAHEATVNEVVLTLCGAALRRYLQEQGALPERPLIANMPIATARPEAGGGNAVLSGFVSLATHLDDPVKRLETVRGSSQHAKQLFRDMPSVVATSIYGGVTSIPFLLAQLAGNANLVHPQNLVISNVAGAREKRYVNGAEVLAEYPFSLLVPGQAMNITVISHADELDVAVLVCPSLVPRPQRVADGLAEALDELEAALARPRRLRAPSRTRAQAAAAAPTKTKTRRQR